MSCSLHNSEFFLENNFQIDDLRIT